MILTLESFDPAKLVSANKRIHHHQRAKVCRYWRELVRTHAMTQRTGQYGRCHVTVHVRYPTNQRRDVGNLYPFVAKPLVDGLVDAATLAADDDQHLIGPDLRRDYPNGPHRIRIEINELP